MVFVSFLDNKFIYSDVKTDFNFELFPNEGKHVYVVCNNDIITDNDIVLDHIKYIYIKIMNIISQLENGTFNQKYGKKYETFSDIFRESNLDQFILINEFDGSINHRFLTPTLPPKIPFPLLDIFGQPQHEIFPLGIESLNLIDPLDHNFLSNHNYRKCGNIKEYLPLIIEIIKKINKEALFKQYFVGTKEDAILKFYHLNENFDSRISINLDYGEDIFIIDGGEREEYSIIMDVKKV